MGTSGRREVTAEKLAQILALSEQGKTQVMISKIVDLSPVTVCRVLRKHDQRVYNELAKSHAAERGRQHLLLQRMFRETWDEWRRSKEPFVNHRVSKPNIVFGTFGKPETVRTESTVKSRTGNPTYIEELLKILEQQRSLLMLDRFGRRDEKANPAAGDRDVTAALEELERIEQAMRAKQGDGQPQAPPETPDEDGGQDDDDRGPGGDPGGQGPGHGGSEPDPPKLGSFDPGRTGW